MKALDLLWLLGITTIALFLINHDTNVMFVSATKAHPYIMGFTKFAILATMGELLSIRIVKGDWQKPVGFLYRILVWGFIGLLTTLYFPIFANGIVTLQQKGVLFGSGNALFTAFLISLIMNTVVGPFIMAFHAFSDTFIELKFTGLDCKLENIISTMNHQKVIGFLILKTIPFFWIPVHVITFMLPPEYRILMAAGLSIVLGVILGFTSRKK
ncbi:MAG: hypothetical protein HN833_00675 [Elusimicrobiaceae bacterium]|jgi:hypothetical protein|nr:hypothetical protein [Elusimicrobiaceae bacterium]MBT3954920.1 hypothetical protein [Elusimicrobiaceae bacterium]MBT4008570.1 hypothetical protein [Elusimicrobiaceae bacterium]MBT4402992.1 hypothetical protein [Elusimicrobiaceae bacterium]MBT4439736.1 hypothetical protein [Elusimicrobiaceae bacterium]